MTRKWSTVGALQELLADSSHSVVRAASRNQLAPTRDRESALDVKGGDFLRLSTTVKLPLPMRI